MNATHRKTLAAVLADPLNGALQWRRIEALFMSLGCERTEGSGSSVTFSRGGIKAYFHPPHPGRQALRYRVRDARLFLTATGAAP